MSAINIPVIVHLPVAGALTVSTVATVQAPIDGRIVAATAAVTTAPTGADLIIDINSGGTSVFAVAGDRVTIAAGETESGVTTATEVEATRDFEAGDVITVDVDQVGSTVAGSDLSVLLTIEGDTNPGA